MSGPLGSQPPGPPQGERPGLLGGQMYLQSQNGMGGQLGLFGPASAGMQLGIGPPFPGATMGPGMAPSQQQGDSSGLLHAPRAQGMPLPRPPPMIPAAAAPSHAALLMAAQAAAATLARTGTPPLPGGAAAPQQPAPPRPPVVGPLGIPFPAPPPAPNRPPAAAGGGSAQQQWYPAPPGRLAGPQATRPGGAAATPPPPPAAAAGVPPPRPPGRAPPPRSNAAGGAVAGASIPPPAPPAVAPQPGPAAAAGGRGVPPPMPPRPFQAAAAAGGGGGGGTGKAGSSTPPPPPGAPPPLPPAAAAAGMGGPMSMAQLTIQGPRPPAAAPVVGPRPPSGSPPPAPPAGNPPPDAALEQKLHAAAGDLPALLRAILEGGYPSGPALILAFDLLAEALQLQQVRGAAAAAASAAQLCGAQGLQRLLGHAGAMLGVLAVDEQLRRLLGCLVRLVGLCQGQFHAGAGGVVPRQLLDALAQQLAHKDAVLEDAGTFLEVCRSFAKLRHVPAALLEEAVLRRLLRLPGATSAGDAGDAGDDGRFGVLLAALQCLASGGLALDAKQQEAVEKVLLDQLARRPTRQVAALVGRYHQLGLAASRVMKKAAAEFARRPEEDADPHMLLEMLEGLAGFGDVKVLPPQLLTRLCDELQQCMPELTGAQLCKACAVLAQLGCLSDRTPRLQQLRSSLQQQLLAQLQQPAAIAGVKCLLPQLEGAAQEHAGVAHLVKALEPAAEQAMGDLDAEGVLQLVAALKAVGDQGRPLLQRLQGQLQSSLELLSGEPGVAGLATTAATAIQQPGLAIEDLVQVVEVASAAALSSSSASSTGANGGQALQVLKQFLGSHYVVNILEGLLALQHGSSGASTSGAAAGCAEAAAGADGGEEPSRAAGTPPAPPPPPPAAAAAGGVHAVGVPPPPPPPAAPQGQQQQEQQQQEQQEPMAGDAGAPSGGGTVPTAISARQGCWPAAVWGACGDLLMWVMQLFPTDPPYEFTAALKDVACQVGKPQAAPVPPPAPSAAAAEGSTQAPAPPPAPAAAPAAQGMAGCSSAAAVQLLWGLAVAGLLELPSWDILAAALDQPGVQLDRDELRKVFEAYSLVVLHTQGPLPRPTPPGQLTGAQEAFMDQALQPVAAQRQLLLAGLQQGGALPPLVGLTGPGSGQALLMDVLDAERQLAWSLQGVRGAAVDAAVSRLLARWSWCLVPVSPDTLNTESVPQPLGLGMLLLLRPAAVQTLGQLFSLARLLPHLHALLYHQRQQGADATTLAGITMLVKHLQETIGVGKVPSLTPAQIATMQQIAMGHPYGDHPGLLATPLPERKRGREAAAAAAAAAAVDAAAVDAEQQQGGEEGRLAGQPSGASLDELFDPRLMDRVELFLHNRVWLSVEDNWWFAQRLLVPKDGAPTSSRAPAAASSEQLTVMAVAAAAAALAVRSKWEAEAQEAARVAAEAAASEAAAEAAARAAAARAVQERQIDLDELMPAAPLGSSPRGRGRSPRRRGPRFWRDERSRSRSNSMDSGVSHLPEDRDHSSSSEEEEGLISEDSEEGEVTGWQLPLSSLKEMLRRKREPSQEPASHVPTRFAARGAVAGRHSGAGDADQGRHHRGSHQDRSRRGGEWDGERGRHVRAQDRGRDAHRGNRKRGRSRSGSQGRSRSGSPHQGRHRYARSRSGSPAQRGRRSHSRDRGDSSEEDGEAGEAQVAATGEAWWLSRFGHVPAAQQQLKQLLLSGMLQERDLFGPGLKAAQLLQEPLLCQALLQLTLVKAQTRLAGKHVDATLHNICTQLRSSAAAAAVAAAAAGAAAAPGGRGFRFGTPAATGAYAGSMQQGPSVAAAAAASGPAPRPSMAAVAAATVAAATAANAAAAAGFAGYCRQASAAGAAAGEAAAEGGAPRGAANYLQQLYAGMQDDGEVYSDVEDGEARKQGDQQPPAGAAAVAEPAPVAPRAPLTAAASGVPLPAAYTGYGGFHSPQVGLPIRPLEPQQAVNRQQQLHRQQQQQQHGNAQQKATFANAMANAKAAAAARAAAAAAVPPPSAGMDDDGAAALAALAAEADEGELEEGEV